MNKRGMSPQKAQAIRAGKGIEETKMQKVRVEKGLSQRELAARVGVSVKTIQFYEQRRRSIDSARLHTICKITDALGCKVVDIIESKELIAALRR